MGDTDNESKGLPRGLSDAPLTDPSEDLLGRAPYAKQIADHLAGVGSPFTLCISGDWGGGKTTFLHFVAHYAKQKHGWESVWVRPWRYDSPEDAQKALLSAVWRSVIQGLPWWYRLGRCVWRILPRLGAAVAATLGRGGASEVAQLVEALFSADEPRADQVQKHLDAHCNRYFQGRPTSRLLVLVDDVERASPAVMQGALEAVQLYAQIGGLIFVVGADLERITQGLEQGAGEGARNPLVKKVFQQVFHLPPLARADLRGFHSQVLQCVPEPFRPSTDIWSGAVQLLRNNARGVKRYAWGLGLAARLARESGLDKDKLAGVVLLSQLLPPALYAVLSWAPGRLVAAQAGKGEPPETALGEMPFPEPWEREAAAAWFEPEVRDFVRKLPPFSDANEVEMYLRYAGPVPAQTADERLRALLSDLEGEDARVRQAAALALSEVKDPEAVEPLLRRLRDDDPNVRAAAAIAIGEIGGAGVLEPLIARLEDDSRHVREAAISALGRAGDVRGAAPLIGTLKSERATTRMKAAQALGQLRSREAADPLIGALADRAWEVRYAAAWALGNIEDRRAVEPLVGALADVEIKVRASAARALERVPDPRAVDALVAQLGATDWELVEAAAQALGKGGGPQAVDALVRLLESGDWTTRRSGALGLGETKAPSAVNALVQRLADENQEVARTAAKALGRIGDRRAVEPLLASLGGGSPLARAGAAEALGEMKDPRAVDPLIRALKDEHPSVRLSASEALGAIGDDRALEPLQPVARDDREPDVRQAAEAAIERIRAGQEQRERKGGNARQE